MQLRSGNKQLIREINQALVLGVVRDRGPISRTAIAHEAHLSMATVSYITSELIDQGLLYEHEEGDSTGGRRPILLALKRDAGLVIGAKLTADQLIVALTDLGGEIVERRIVALRGGGEPAVVVEQIGLLADELRRAHTRRIYGAGLGMAGFIDQRTGVVRFSPFLHWQNVPLRAMLEQRLGMPVVIENDVNTLAMAELWFGAGVGVSDFLVVTLGSGVGMGMVLNGQIYRGGGGGGGEFGHLTMVPDGPRCNCGKRGCLETLVADPALLQRFRDALGRDVTMAEAVALAHQGDPSVQAIFAAAGRSLGLALSHLVNIFNPTLIVVGGEGAQALDLLFEPLKSTLAAHCFNGFFHDMRLVVAPSGDDAWAQGAASLMLRDLFGARLYRSDDRQPSPILARSPERA